MQKGTCLPSVRTIASDCGVSERTVQRAVKVILEEGFIQKESRYRNNGGQSSNLYVLQIEDDGVDKDKGVCLSEVNSANEEETVVEVERIADEIDVVSFEDYKGEANGEEVQVIESKEALVLKNVDIHVIAKRYKKLKCHSSTTYLSAIAMLRIRRKNFFKLQCHRVSDNLYPP